MRHKKPSPPLLTPPTKPANEVSTVSPPASPTPALAAPTDHGQEAANLRANEGLLEHLLLDADLNPEQMGAVVMTLFIYASVKRAQPEYLSKLMPVGIHLISLLEACKSEVRLIRAMPLTDEQKKPLLDATVLSQEEIGSDRRKLWAMFEELRMVPPHWVSRN